MKILLIEPDFVLGRVYAKALAADGHKVRVVRGAQAAISAADKLAPELVILELQLIEHSGIEFLYEFRSYPDWQDIAVIIHSQVPPSEFIDSWQLLKHDLGISCYLYKPQTTLKTLLKHVGKLNKVAA